MKERLPNAFEEMVWRGYFEGLEQARDVFKGAAQRHGYTETITIDEGVELLGKIVDHANQIHQRESKK